MVLTSAYSGNERGHQLDHLQQQLDRQRAAGAADNSPAVISSSLQIIGQSWMQQTAQSRRLLNGQFQLRSTPVHRLGIVAQEEGYYIDVGHQLNNTAATTSGAANHFASLHATSHLHSALEHGVLEQLQVERPAASTVKILQLANAAGQRIYRADKTNAEHLRSNSLQDYSDTFLQQLVSDSLNHEALYILPQRGAITLEQWTGYYVSVQDYNSGKHMTMGISGDHGELNGGYGARLGDIHTPDLVDNYSPDQYYSAELNNPRSDEPVDLATGAYLYDHRDLSIGEAAPRGIHFARTYNSEMVARDHGLGYGWDHNWNAYISQYSEADHGLARAASPTPSARS